MLSGNKAKKENEESALSEDCFNGKGYDTFLEDKEQSPATLEVGTNKVAPIEEKKKPRITGKLFNSVCWKW